MQRPLVQSPRRETRVEPLRLLLISGNHQVRRFELSQRLVKGVLGSLVGLGLVLAVTTAGLFHYWQGYRATEAIRVENARYDQDRAALLTRVASLEETVERADRLAVRLEGMGDVPAGGVLTKGIGPLSESLDLPLLPAGGLQAPGRGAGELYAFNDIAHNMDALKARAREVEERLGKVYDVRKERNAFFAALPSLWPVRGYVTSGFGPRRSTRVGGTRFHRGIDIAAPVGTQIHASGDGVVTFAGYRGGYGKALIIDHGFGMTTLYGHNRELFVKEGDRVRRGMVISAVGMTGRTTGAHLHYEVSVDGVPVNPARYLASR